MSRGDRIILAEAPGGPGCWKPGHCAWCGEEIVFIDAAKSYRQRQRTRHRGDEHEAGDRNCHREHEVSYVWDPRRAVRIREFRERGAIACVDCGTVCEKAPKRESWREVGAAGQVLERWDADHEIPLVDGGEHVLENLRSRCVPCHREKTAREAAERSRRRRAGRRQMPRTPRPTSVDTGS